MLPANEKFTFSFKAFNSSLTYIKSGHYDTESPDKKSHKNNKKLTELKTGYLIFEDHRKNIDFLLSPANIGKNIYYINLEGYCVVPLSLIFPSQYEKFAPLSLEPQNHHWVDYLGCYNSLKKNPPGQFISLNCKVWLATYNVNYPSLIHNLAHLSGLETKYAKRVVSIRTTAKHNEYLPVVVTRPCNL